MMITQTTVTAADTYFPYCSHHAFSVAEFFLLFQIIDCHGSFPLRIAVVMDLREARREFRQRNPT
jgi:hypothetical protein